MRGKIAVVGDKESVLGFKAVGFDAFDVASPQDAESLIRRLARQQYGIIFITEQMFAPIAKVADEFKSSKIPAIIPIPGKEGSLGIGMYSVKKSVERAVGADILFKD